MHSARQQPPRHRASPGTRQPCWAVALGRADRSSAPQGRARQKAAARLNGELVQLLLRGLQQRGRRARAQPRQHLRAAPRRLGPGFSGGGAGAGRLSCCTTARCRRLLRKLSIAAAAPRCRGAVALQCLL